MVDPCPAQIVRRHVVVHERRHVQELHGRRRGLEVQPRASVARRAQEDEQRPQALAARRERLGAGRGDAAGGVGDRALQASLDLAEERRGARRLERAALVDGAQRATSPTCRATMPPASSR
jgi:hypothetical protein